jgi:O-antigen/teichoic acid export membrane protein
VNKSSVVAIGFAYAVAVFLCLFVSLFFVLRNFSRFSLKINPNVCRKILAVAYPFALSSVAVFAYYRIDTVILGFHRSASELGYYDAAYNIILVAVAPITFFVIATFPFLSRIYKESREKFTKVIDNFFKLIFVLSFPFIAAFFFNAGLIINIIYGQKFLRFSPQFLQVLVWSVLILYNYSIFAVGLSASDNQKTYSMAVICGAVFNIIANLIFIPIYGAIAAAVITVLTEIVVCVYMSYKFLSFQKMRLPWVFIFKILFSFVIMAISIIVFNRLFDVGLLLASFFGVAIYGVAVFAFIGRKNLLAISKF